MSSYKASEIPRNEAYIEVLRSDSLCYIGFAVSRSENLTGRERRVFWRVFPTGEKVR
jgi:hypothetical protein